MFLPYVVRKAFQTVVLVSAVLIVATGCGGGDDEDKVPPMPPVVTPPDDGGTGEEPLSKQSLFLPETSLERLVYTFETAHEDRRGFAERYFGPPTPDDPHRREGIVYQRLGAVAQGPVVSSANISGGYRAGDGHLVDARLSGDGSGNLSVFLERSNVIADGEGLPFSLGTLASSQSGAVHRWDARGMHRTDGDGDWRLKGVGWQSTDDFGDWAVMGFYLVDEGVRDSNDRGIQVGTFALSPSFRKDLLYAGVLPADVTRPEEDVRYEGPTYGLMVDSYGTGRSHAAGTVAEAAYTGRATIDVTLGQNTRAMPGRVKSILIDGLATYGEGRLTLPDGRRLALPSGTAIPTTYTGQRSNSGPLASLVDPIGFSAALDANDHPRFLGGSYSVEDRESWGDGSVTYLLGSYLAATEASGLRDDLNALVGN